MTDATAEGGTYVLQVEMSVTIQGNAGSAEGQPVWFDVATITVPPRTKRKTAIHRALRKAKMDVAEETKVRLLDAESAEVRTVRPRPPAAPELEIV